MQKQQKKSSGFLIIVGISSICIVGFLILDKLTSVDMKGVVMSRLTKGVVETRKKVTPERKALDSVNSNRSRIVRIYKNSCEDSEKSKGDNFLARGIIYSTDGWIVTVNEGFQEGVEYALLIPGQRNLNISSPVQISKHFVFFKIEIGKSLVVQTDSSKVAKRDLIVAISGKEEDAMATGEVVEINNIAESTFIGVTVPVGGLAIGAPLLNIEQKVIGLYYGVNVNGKAEFISVEGIDREFKQ